MDEFTSIGQGVHNTYPEELQMVKITKHLYFNMFCIIWKFHKQLNRTKAKIDADLLHLALSP